MSWKSEWPNGSKAFVLMRSKNCQDVLLKSRTEPNHQWFIITSRIFIPRGSKMSHLLFVWGFFQCLDNRQKRRLIARKCVVGATHCTVLRNSGIQPFVSHGEAVAIINHLINATHFYFAEADTSFLITLSPLLLGSLDGECEPEPQSSHGGSHHWHTDKGFLCQPHAMAVKVAIHLTWPFIKHI